MTSGGININQFLPTALKEEISRSFLGQFLTTPKQPSKRHLMKQAQQPEQQLEPGVGDVSKASKSDRRTLEDEQMITCMTEKRPERRRQSESMTPTSTRRHNRTMLASPGRLSALGQVGDDMLPFPNLAPDADIKVAETSHRSMSQDYGFDQVASDWNIREDCRLPDDFPCSSLPSNNRISISSSSSTINNNSDSFQASSTQSQGISNHSNHLHNNSNKPSSRMSSSERLTSTRRRSESHYSTTESGSKNSKNSSRRYSDKLTMSEHRGSTRRRSSTSATRGSPLIMYKSSSARNFNGKDHRRHDTSNRRSKTDPQLTTQRTVSSPSRNDSNAITAATIPTSNRHSHNTASYRRSSDQGPRRSSGKSPRRSSDTSSRHTSPGRCHTTVQLESKAEKPRHHSNIRYLEAPRTPKTPKTPMKSNSEKRNSSSSHQRRGSTGNTLPPYDLKESCESLMLYDGEGDTRNSKTERRRSKSSTRHGSRDERVPGKIVTLSTPHTPGKIVTLSTPHTPNGSKTTPREQQPRPSKDLEGLRKAAESVDSGNPSMIPPLIQLTPEGNQSCDIVSLDSWHLENGSSTQRNTPNTIRPPRHSGKNSQGRNVSLAKGSTKATTLDCIEKVHDCKTESPCTVSKRRNTEIEFWASLSGLDKSRCESNLFSSMVW